MMHLCILMIHVSKIYLESFQTTLNYFGLHEASKPQIAQKSLDNIFFIGVSLEKRQTDHFFSACYGFIYDICRFFQ